MNKTIKRVLSSILTAAIVVSSPLFGSFANGESLEEHADTAVEDSVARATTGVIASGTYYISNVQFDKVVQIDDNASSTSTAGVILELWGRDNGADQKWIITQLSNGYYNIKSAASKLAITAPEKKDNALTQETYTGADTQLWKITLTSDNLFKLSPKSNSSYYMAAGGGVFTSNGRNVEMRDNQNDNKDEWYLLNTSKKYSQVTLDYSDSTSFNKSVKESYEKNAHAYGTTYTSISKSTFMNELKSSNYFGGMLHGNLSALKISNTESVSLSDITDLSNSNFNSVKVVVLTACSSYQFVEALRSKGVSVVIGFTGDVEKETSAYWTEQLISALSAGNTVEYSLKYATNALSSEYSSAYYEEVVNMIKYGYYTGTTDLKSKPCA